MKSRVSCRDETSPAGDLLLSVIANQPCSAIDAKAAYVIANSAGG